MMAVSTCRSLSFALLPGGNESRRKADLSWSYELTTPLLPATSAAVILPQLPE